MVFAWVFASPNLGKNHMFVCSTQITWGKMKRNFDFDKFLLSGFIMKTPTCPMFSCRLVDFQVDTCWDLPLVDLWWIGGTFGTCQICGLIFILTRYHTKIIKYTCK